MKRKEIRKKLKAMVAQLVADRINPNALIEVAERLRKNDGQILELTPGMAPIYEYYLLVYDEIDPILGRAPLPHVITIEQLKILSTTSSTLKCHAERIYTDKAPLPISGFIGRQSTRRVVSKKS